MTWIRCVWLKWHAKCSVLGAFKVYFSAEFSSIANQTHLNKLVFDCFCLWVFLPLGLSSASEIHLRPGNRLGHCWTFHFYTFKNSWVASAVCFGSYPSVLSTVQSTSAFGWMWVQSISINPSVFWLLLSSVTSTVNANDPVPLEAMHAHAITLPQPCFIHPKNFFFSITSLAFNMVFVKV